MCKILYNVNSKIIECLMNLNYKLSKRFIPRDFREVAEYCNSISEL